MTVAVIAVAVVVIIIALDIWEFGFGGNDLDGGSYQAEWRRQRDGWVTRVKQCIYRRS